MKSAMVTLKDKGDPAMVTMVVFNGHNGGVDTPSLPVAAWSSRKSRIMLA
jgi:hypothetical protein